MELMKRKIDADKSLIDWEEVPVMQLSYNSDGRLCIRFYNPNDQSNDVLMNFTRSETLRLARFLEEIGLLHREFRDP